MVIPIISALIGWFTNYIAVKMIFRPRREVRFLGIRWQGLIPKRKQDMAIKIAETVEKELISHRDIREIVQSTDFHHQTSQVIKTQIDDFILEKVASNPLLGMFLSPEVTERLSVMLMEELQKKIPHAIDSLFESIESKIDFREIIRSKIEGFDLARLESIVYSIASRELKSIEVLGGVLGFVVGLVQVAILIIGNVYG